MADGFEDDVTESTSSKPAIKIVAGFVEDPSQVAKPPEILRCCELVLQIRVIRPWPECSVRASRTVVINRAH